MSSSSPDDYTGSEIAIVGLAGRFPGAPDIDTYWTNLRDGVESLRRYSDEELAEAGVPAALRNDPNFVPVHGAIDDPAAFDAGFFGLNPQDAAVMDPQHRVFLECVGTALNHAGLDPARSPAAIGLFAGCGMNTYFQDHLATNPDLLERLGYFHVRHTGNDKDFLSTRASYAFDLKGPSVNVQTACSTSLAAVHMAVQSLLSGECDAALAGGSTIELKERWGYQHQPGDIHAPDGHCRAFDADAQGTVFGSGAGVVVLKRYEDAVADGDTIHAVLRGTAINNDGAQKAGYLAPSVDGQAAAAAEALALTDLDPASISYIECHGTGTPVGDPIEISALTQAYGPTAGNGRCAIGSVKTNIGHLDTAAGVASLIKVVEALKHRQLPPSLHFTSPNPTLNLDQTPFTVNDTLRDWDANGGPRRAAVNSLGVGGTNAHVIVEEAPAVPETPAPSNPQILPLSAKTPEALDRLTAAMGRHFDEHPDTNLADASATLQTGRPEYSYRRVLVGTDAEAIAEQGALPHPMPMAARSNRAVGFLFPGGGAQYPNMARDLYETEPVVTAALDEAFSVLTDRDDLDLRPILFPDPNQTEAARAELQRPSRGLPALLAVELAMARLWRSWDIEPDGMIGHSAGEYAAACVADVMSMADALHLMCVRGRLFERLPAGGMLSVPAPEGEVRPLLPDALSIATVNTPQMCVVSGPVDALDAFEQDLLARNVEGKRVPIDVAAHSPMLDGILDEYRDAVQSVTLRPPTRRFASNLTGTWITDNEATSPNYWTRHLRETVRFADGVKNLLSMTDPFLLELGPGHTLSTFADTHDDRPDAMVACPTLRHPKESVADNVFVRRAFGTAWAAGLDVDWETIRDTPGRRIPLPTYPYARDTHWIEPGESRLSSDPLRRRDTVDDFFSAPSWSPSVLRSEPAPVANETWLVFADDRVAPTLLDRAQDAGTTVIRVERGSRFNPKSKTHVVLRPDEADDYERLFRELGPRAESITRIVHAWNVTGSKAPARDSLEETGGGWPSLFFLSKALINSGLSQSVDLAILGDHLHALPGDATLHPDKSTLFGPARVLPRELPNVSTRVIDLPGTLSDETLNQLWAELRSKRPDDVVAYRNGRRYTPTLSDTPLDAPAADDGILDPDGVYLVTGGTGGLALTLVKHLAERAPATFVLTSRSALPPRADWTDWLDSHSPAHPTARTIRSIQAIEANGATVQVEAVDVTDESAMRMLVKRVASAHGPIRGAFHTAGVLDDAPISLKEADAVNRVLAPKVTGTQVLRTVLQDQPLDRLVLFSSVSAQLGLPGQVDYCAANAYLDAAAQQFSLDGLPTVAVDWSAWQDVGMAAELADPTTNAGTPLDHPVLSHWVDDGPTHRFAGTITPDQWMVDEHRLPDGTAVVPGTGYVELIVAALRKLQPDTSPTIQSLTFEAPLRVTTPTDIEIVFREDDPDALELTVSSRTTDGWIDHAQGQVQTTANDTDVPSFTEPQAGTLYTPETGFPRNHQHTIMDFGPRWDVLDWMRLDGTTGWARLDLDAAYKDDETTFTAHPALLDIATAFALPVLEEYAAHEDFYVPVAYEGLTIHRPLPSTLVSRMHCHTPTDRDLVSFEVTLWDEDGTLLATIDRFTMKRVRPEVLSESASTPPSVRRPAEASDGPPILPNTASLSPKEGCAVLDRVLTTTATPQLVVSPVDLTALQADLDQKYGPPSPDPSASSNRDAAAPDGEGPRDEIERTVANIWSSMLGVSSIGIHDDFFDVGGHSLIAIRIFSKVKNELGVELPLSTLLQAPTIAEYADLIRAEKGQSLEDPAGGDGLDTDADASVEQLSHTGSALPSPAPITSRAFNPLVPIQRKGERRPFFCVHGAGGNVLNFRDLAVRLGTDQPVFGLQARGVDGRFAPHETIEEMAEEYLKAIRHQQPEGPYQLGGYSGGGVIAYEMAQQLRQAGDAVGLLAFIDTYHPHLPPAPTLRLPDRLRRRLARIRAEGWSYLPKYLTTRLLYERNRLREWGIRLYDHMDWPLPLSLRELLMVRSFHAAAARYEPDPYPGRIVLFGASDKGDLADRVGDDLGWTDMIDGTLEIVKIPGNHDSLVREPNISVLANRLRQELALADASASA